MDTKPPSVPSTTSVKQVAAKAFFDTQSTYLLSVFPDFHRRKVVTRDLEADLILNQFTANPQDKPESTPVGSSLSSWLSTNDKADGTANLRALASIISADIHTVNIRDVACLLRIKAEKAFLNKQEWIQDMVDSCACVVTLANHYLYTKDRVKQVMSFTEAVAISKERRLGHPSHDFSCQHLMFLFSDLPLCKYEQDSDKDDLIAKNYAGAIRNNSESDNALPFQLVPRS